MTRAQAKPQVQSADALFWLAVWLLAAPDDLLTVTEAATACGRTPSCVRLWCERGKVGFWDQRLKTWLIWKDQLTAFIEAHPSGWRGVPQALRDFAPTQTRSVLNSRYEHSTPTPQRSIDARRTATIRSATETRRADAASGRDRSANRKQGTPAPPRPRRARCSV
jgi:hypothetical protein